MNGIKSRIVSRQSAVDFVSGFQFHSFLRKFKSHETVSPNRLAVCNEAFAAAAAFSLMAGVIPVI